MAAGKIPATPLFHSMISLNLVHEFNVYVTERTLQVSFELIQK